MRRFTSRERRVFLGAAIALVGFPILYAIVAAILLGDGRLGRMVSKHPERLRLQYASASSLWFGRAHVEGLDLRGRDKAVEWELHVDRADLSISIVGLLAHHVHITRVEADGVSYRMRLRRTPSEMDADKIARLPPIDGFASPPLEGVPELPPHEGKPFVITVDGIEAHGVHDVWLDVFRLTGDLDIRGAFEIAPHDHLDVKPSHVEVRAAKLATGEDTIVDTHGTIDATIEPTPLNGLSASSVLRHVTSRSSFEGTLGGITFLRHFIPEAVVPSGGAGTFRGAVIVERGVVRKDSTSHVEIGPAAIAVANHRFETRTTIDTRVTEDDAGHAGDIDVLLGDVALYAGAKTPAVTSDAIRAHAHVDETDIASLPRDFAYSWDAPKSHIKDLRVFDAALAGQSVFAFEGGAATASTSGSGTMHGLDARAALEGTAAMGIDGAHATARTSSHVGCKLQFSPLRADFGGTEIDFADLTVRGSAPHPGWTGRVKLESATLKTPLAFDARIAASAHDARPLLALYAAMRDVSSATRTALAIVPDPAIDAATASTSGGMTLHAEAGTIAIHGLDMHGAATRVRGEMTKHGPAKSGGFLFEAGPLSVGVAFEGEGAKPIVVDARGWFEQLARR